MWLGRSAVLLFLVAVPGCASLIEAFSAHDLSRIAQVAMSVVCAIVLAGTAVADRRYMKFRAGPAALVGACAFVVLALASVFHAPVQAAAARELAMVLGLAGIAVVIADCRNPRQMETLGIAVVTAASLYVALVLMSVFITIGNAGSLDRFTVALGYDNCRHFNHVQTVVIPLLAIATRRTFRQGEFARLAWVALTLQFALLIFTLGRATGLALLAAALLSLVLFRHAALTYVRQLAIAAVIGGLVYVGIFVVLPSLIGAQAQPLDRIGSLDSYGARLMLWRLAIDHIAQEPLLGIGPMHYAHHVNGDAAHPHNIYLQLASEWGVPMLVGLAALSVWTAWRMARAIRACAEPGQLSMGIGIFTAVIAVAIDAMFSGNFVMPVAQVWIAVMIGWAVAWTRLNAPADTRADRVVVPWLGGVVAGAILVASQAWLCWSIAPEVRNMGAHLDHVRLDVTGSDRASPRFWSNGWF